MEIKVSEYMMSFSIFNIKSHYFIRKLFEYNKKIKILKIIKYNKELQSILGIDLETYKYFGKILIELIPHKENIQTFREYCKPNEEINFKFINYKIEDIPYFHIYFNDSEIESRRNNINFQEDVYKIRIVIDRKVKSLVKLFSQISGMKEINFIKFNRYNFVDLSFMFHSCEYLTYLNISRMKTENVTSMHGMFKETSSLININLSNLKTYKVKNMSSLFEGCYNLKKLDLSSFDTSNVIDMSNMFNGCQNLESINISSFDTSNVININKMFYLCKSLCDLNISHFNLKNVKSMKKLFFGINKKLIQNIIKQNKDLKPEAFGN